MAEGIKISEMEQVATLEDGCCFPVVSNGVNKKITKKNLLEETKSITNVLRSFGRYKDGTRPTSATELATQTVDNRGGMRKDVVTGSMTEGKPPIDGHILTFFWDNLDNWNSQMVVENKKNPKIFVRGQGTGDNDTDKSWSEWEELAKTKEVNTLVSDLQNQITTNRTILDGKQTVFITYDSAALLLNATNFFRNPREDVYVYNVVAYDASGNSAEYMAVHKYNELTHVKVISENGITLRAVNKFGTFDFSSSVRIIVKYAGMCEDIYNFTDEKIDRSEMNAQQTKIVNLQNQIDSNDKDITSLQSQIDSNDTDITDLQSQIDSNKTDLQNQIDNKVNIEDLFLNNSSMTVQATTNTNLLNFYKQDGSYAGALEIDTDEENPSINFRLGPSNYLVSTKNMNILIQSAFQEINSLKERVSQLEGK